MTVGRSLAITYSGNSTPVNSGVARHSTMPAGTTPAGGGIPWVGDETAANKHCEVITDGERCKAYKAKETEFCAGHLRKFGVVVEAGE